MMKTGKKYGYGGFRTRYDMGTLLTITTGNILKYNRQNVYPGDTAAVILRSGTEIRSRINDHGYEYWFPVKGTKASGSLRIRSVNLKRRKMP